MRPAALLAESLTSIVRPPAACGQRQTQVATTSRPEYSTGPCWLFVPGDLEGPHGPPRRQRRRGPRGRWPPFAPRRPPLQVRLAQRRPPTKDGPVEFLRSRPWKPLMSRSRYAGAPRDSRPPASAAEGSLPLGGFVCPELPGPHRGAERGPAPATTRAAHQLLEMSFAQYHLPRAKPPKAISPIKTMISPIKRLHTNIRTIPTITMMPPSDMPAIPRRSSDPATPSLLRVNFLPHRFSTPLRDWRNPGGRRQRLIVCPLLDAALEFFRRRRGCVPWMPSDPDDLATTPARTAGCRRPIARGQALAVSAAALTDHVCDHWHGASQAPVSQFGGAHSRLDAETPRNLQPSQRSASGQRGNVVRDLFSVHRNAPPR